MSTRAAVMDDQALTPRVCEDDGDVPHALCANFGEGDSHVRFAMDKKGVIHLLSIYSDGDVRGRVMVAWLKQAYGRPVLVDEVAQPAIGFWNKMQDEGLIAYWSEEPFSGEVVPIAGVVSEGEASQPIRAYHATNAAEDFERFDLTEDYGFHFGSFDAANKRIDDLFDPDDPDLWSGVRIIPCWLDIKNPLRLIDCHTWGPRDTMLALRHAGVLVGQQFDELWQGGYLDQAMFREIVERAGYDSIVYENLTEQGGDSYMVLVPEQIRFALTDPAPVPKSAHKVGGPTFG